MRPLYYSILSALFALLLLTEARAGNTVVSGKDSAGVSHNFYVVTDGSGNYYPGQVICDQSAAAQCAGVTGGFALQSDATSMGGTAISSTCVNGGGGVGSGNCPTVNILNSALPTGGATSANQATEITALNSIVTNTGLGAVVDEAAFTEGTTSVISMGCYFKTAPVALTTGQAGGVTCTSRRGMFTNLDSVAGTALGTPTNFGTTPGAVVAASVNSSTFIGTVAAASGNGVTGTGSQRVTIASDNTAFAVNAAAASAVNVTPTDCSIALTTGGTAQNIITAGATLHGFTIANIDTAAGSGEPVWMSFTGTAVASATASYPLAAPTATTFAGLSSYTSPLGFGTNANVSVIAATTGHKISCTKW